MITGMKPEACLLTDENIELSSEEASRFLASVQVEKREALSIKLSLEEVLLNFQEKFGKEVLFQLRCIKRFSAIRIEVVIPGESYDPLGKETEEYDVIHAMMARIGLAPTWNYKKGKNYIVFTPKKKPLSDTVKIGMAMGLAILAGLLLNYLPSGVSSSINNYALTPMTDTFLGLLSAVSGPLIFLTVLGSICSMGTIETFGKIGNKTMKFILLYMVIICGILTAVGCFLFHVTLSDGGTAGFSAVLDLIYDIVPSNLFEPFITGNMMQCIFIALVVGIAMLSLSTRVTGVFHIIEQLSAIVQTIMAGLSTFLPVLIFTLFTGLISRGEVEVAFSSWKLLGMSLLLMVIYYAGCFFRVVILKKISPSLLLKKVGPTFLIALSTASSAAALVSNIKDATEKLGVNKKLAEFALPLGQILFMPDSFIMLFCVEIFLADLCDIPITLPWLIIGFGTNLLLALAIPPVPGGTIMGLTIAFEQLGIPMEVMGIAIAINALTDFPGSATSVSGMQLILIDIAESLGMLDRNILHQDEK